MSNQAQYKAIRGMHDLWGEELEKWHAVEKSCLSTLHAFGYTEFRTPVLEMLEVFSQSVGEETDIVEKQMYQLQTESGEKLVLRPEGTSAFVRAVLEHQLHRLAHPQRYFYYLPMFRYERPQKGRLRQFHQIGAELLLDPSPEADAEIILLLDQIFKAFGLTEYEIRVNSVGCETCRPPYKEVLKKYLGSRIAELCPQCQKRMERSPLRVLDCKNPTCANLVGNAPKMVDHLCEPCKTHHIRVSEGLALTGLPVVQDPNIVRGLDYYSRTAFEFTSNLLGAQSALGGGGRYDGLAKRFGSEAIPAVGFALGVERLLLALEAKSLIPKVDKGGSIYFAPLGKAAYDQLFALSFALKRKGLQVLMSYEPEKPLKWQLKQADRLKVEAAVILGDDELKKGEVVLKEMKTGNQSAIALEKLEEEMLRRFHQ